MFVNLYEVNEHNLHIPQFKIEISNYDLLVNNLNKIKDTLNSSSFEKK